MSFEPRDYLRHILDEARYLLRESEDLDLAGFLGDDTRRRAFVRSLEIIGEATKQVPDAFRVLYPDVEWRAMAAMRDRLIHAYFGVDYELVWNVVVEKIPPLEQRIMEMLEGD